MDWQERLFQRSYNYLSRSLRRTQKIQRSERRVHLQDLRPSLTLLANALTGESIEILPTKSFPGWASKYIFLPHQQDNFESEALNALYFRYMVFYLCQMRSMNVQWDSSLGKFEADRGLDLASLKADNTRDALFSEFPATRGHYEDLMTGWVGDDVDMSWLNGTVLPPIYIEEKTEKAVDRGQYVPEEEREADEMSEVMSDHHSMTQNLEVDTDAQDDFILMHQFEKVETLEEFKGNWRDMDGSDEMDDHEDALQDLDMEHTVRVDMPVHSVFKTDFLINSSVNESGDLAEQGGIPYDEWNFSKFTYRKDYCRVHPRIAESSSENLPEHWIPQSKLVNELRHQFNHWLNEWDQVHAQPDGHDLDLKATVQNYALRMAGLTPDERIYLSNRKRTKDLALVILIDSSLSSDSYTNGKKILDIEKAAVLALGDVLDEFDIRFQIDAFSSKTRHHCHYTTLKPFDRSWRASQLAVASHAPQGYTRIGPSIRHATSLLEKEASRDKWILMLSDGKPNDYDRYEGLYGMEDVKRALLEAQQLGIFTHAMAVDSKGRFYLPQMFGHQAFSLLKNVEELPRIMSEVIVRQMLS